LLFLKNVFLFISLIIVFGPMLVYAAPVGKLQKPVAKVNGTVLTEADLEEALNEIMPAGVFHGGFSSEKRMSQRPKALEKMIDKELFYQEAVRKGLSAEDEIDVDIKKTIKRLKGEKNYRAALKKAKLTEKQYKEKLRKKHLLNKFIAGEVKDKAEASDKEIKNYYGKNKKKYFRPEARRIRHILIKVPPNASSKDRALKKQRAQEVIDKIKAGEDMSMVAWDYSDDPYRVKGGDYGLVHTGRLDPDLEKEVFRLEPGRLSGIIETRYGYHVVRVDEIKAPEQLSFEDVAEKIKKELTKKKEEQIREALIKNLREKSEIEKYVTF
jgi:peptidyl-prolyl cis-trans isomerase C